MYRRLRLAVINMNAFSTIWGGGQKSVVVTGVRPFNLLRWFSILSFAVVALISIGFASTLTHFLTREILQRDALLTSQFVTSIVTVQNQQARMGRGVTLGKILDTRTDFARLGVDLKEAASVRSQFYDHISLLPDQLLTSLDGIQ